MGKLDFEICQIVQQKAIKFVQQNFPNVQKNVCALLVMGKVVHIGFWTFLANPNGQNVELCTMDLQ